VHSNDVIKDPPCLQPQPSQRQPAPAHAPSKFVSSSVV
jgi:hypothetical protein